MSADKCREDLKGDAHKDTRKQLNEQASAIYQAETAPQARARLATFADTWQGRAPKQSMLSSATLNRPLPTTRWKEWHANSCAPPRCWNAPIASYGASFAKSAALAVPRAQRSPSFYRSSGSMLAGRNRPGGRPPNSSSSSFSLSTLREGYATLPLSIKSTQKRQPVDSSFDSRAGTCCYSSLNTFR